MNFEIDECYDGLECLDKINSGNSYDLILMDIMMPNMDGETTMEKLRQIEGFNTPVIAVTADAVSGSKEKYLEKGFIDYISKPFSRDQIKEKIDKIFNDNTKLTLEQFQNIDKDNNYSSAYVYDSRKNEEYIIKNGMRINNEKKEG